MKKYLLVFFSICCFTQLHAQKFELNADFYAGLFHYDGNGTTSTSFVHQGNPTFTDNPYGNKNGYSYGGGLRLQYVTKGGFIGGMQVDYENLRSKLNTTYIEPTENYLYDMNYMTDLLVINSANGESFIRNQNINFSPYIGYRIITGAVKIDFMPGIDIGFNINTYDKGDITDADNVTYYPNAKIEGTPTDFRLRFGAAASYKRFGVTASYAYGLTNLYKLDESGNSGSYNAHSQLIRFGVTYRIF